MFVIVLGGKGEGAAGIFEAWDVNYDGKITVEEVGFFPIVPQPDIYQQFKCTHTHTVLETLRQLTNCYILRPRT